MLPGAFERPGEDLSFSSSNVQITLAERIDFAQLSFRDVQPTLRHVAAWGGVSFSVQSRDDQNRPKSYQQMTAPNLDIDFVSGDLSAEGPGRLSFTSADQLMPSIGTQTNPIDSESSNTLTHLAIAFQTRLQGNMHRRDLHLFDNIRMWKGPVPSWTDSVDPTERVALRKDDVWMSCYELFVLESPTAAPTLQRKPIELFSTWRGLRRGTIICGEGQRNQICRGKRHVDVGRRRAAPGSTLATEFSDRTAARARGEFAAFVSGPNQKKHFSTAYSTLMCPPRPPRFNDNSPAR